MQGLFKNKGVTIVVVVIAILLSGIAIFTATKLYTNKRAQQQAAPTVVPESRPVVTEESEELTFNVGPTIPPTPTPTSAAIASASASPSPNPASSFGGLAKASHTPSPSATPSPTTTASASPTAQPELPEAGVGTPTIVGIATGAMLLILAFALAL